MSGGAAQFILKIMEIPGQLNIPEEVFIRELGNLIRHTYPGTIDVEVNSVSPFQEDKSEELRSKLTRGELYEVSAAVTNKYKETVDTKNFRGVFFSSFGWRNYFSKHCPAIVS